MARAAGYLVLLLGAGCGGQAESIDRTRHTQDAGAPVDSGSNARQDASGSHSLIEGRWAAVGFPELVGVQLTQRDTRIEGAGCAFGVPPLAPNTDVCAAIVDGRLLERHVRFSFGFDGYNYDADLFVSEDGQRMAGRFVGNNGDLELPTAWLRVQADAFMLESDLPRWADPVAGAYDLQLEAGTSRGDEFSATAGYTFIYTPREIMGDLGAFWQTEMRARADRIQVGPVPASHPDLPHQLELSVSEQTVQRVTATTPSGGHYVFSATRR